jgi:hypothetical protein
MTRRTVTLPYDFDTSRVWRTILTGALAIEAIVVIGFVYRVLVSPDAMAAVGLALSGAMLAFFIRVFVRFQSGSVGTITKDRIVIHPNVLYGIRLPGPQPGEYAAQRFSAVRVEMMSGAISHGDVLVHHGPHERIWLVGKDGAPDILIARTQQEAGPALAKEFGAALALPVEQTRSPY